MSVSTTLTVLASALGGGAAGVFFSEPVRAFFAGKASRKLPITIDLRDKLSPEEQADWDALTPEQQAQLQAAARRFGARLDASFRAAVGDPDPRGSFDKFFAASARDARYTELAEKNPEIARYLDQAFSAPPKLEGAK